MSAVPVTLVGTFTQDNGQSYNGQFVGLAVITGLGVGGGPIIPPPFDPNAPRPTHPIMLPGMPGWGDPHPEHPIVIPPPPDEKPPDTGSGDSPVLKPPPPDGGWGYVEPYGWAYFPGPSDPGPHKK